MFKDLNRYYYFGSSPFKNDSSRVELLDPIGFHEPTTIYTTVGIGKLQRIPTVLKTSTFKWGNVMLDWLDAMVPESAPIKPVVTLLINAIIIGDSKTTSITR